MVTDRRRDGNTLAMTYDALNRQITKSGPGISTIYTSYDLLGRKTAVTYGSPTGTGSAYTYDALNRVTSETTYGYRLGFQYDLAGDQTGVTWWDGFSLAYAYDTDGEMTSIQPSGANSTVGVLASYAYDDLGRRLSVSRGNGVSSAYGYDGISRLTSLAHTMSGGNIQNQTYSLAYTASNQIRTQALSNTAYEFDPPSATRTYAVNGQNELTSSSGAAVSYDARGNLASDSVTNYNYDLLNRLQSTSGARVTATAYDPQDRLITLTANGTTTQFAYIGPDVSTEFNPGNGQIYRRYVPGPAEDETAVWYEGADASNPRWLLEDHQGSIVAVTDSTGGAIGINSYDEYGAPAAANLGRLQYTGQLWLSEIGLYDYKARLYSGGLGRFMQTDPVGYNDGLNWYDYVGDDPLNRTDPTGDDSYIIYRPVIFMGLEVSKHSFVVVTDDHGRVVQRYSFGPSRDSLINPGQLVYLTNTKTRTDLDDEHALERQDNPGVIVVRLTSRGYKDSDVVSSGDQVKSELGTKDKPGPTKYSAVPDGKNGDANSNSAARAVVQGATPNGAPTYTTPPGVVAVGDKQSDKVGTSSQNEPDADSNALKSFSGQPLPSRCAVIRGYCPL